MRGWSLLKSRRFWLGLLLGLGLLALFFYRANFGEIGSALAQARYIYLLPAVPVYFVAVVFRTLRWHYLLHPLKEVPSRRLFPVVVIGYMANNLLPVRLGDVVRSYLVGEKEGMSKAAALTTTIVERLFDGLALVLLLLILLPLVPLKGVSAEWSSSGLVLALIAVGAAIVALLAAVFVVTLSPRLAGTLGNLGLRFLPRRLHERARDLGTRFYSGLDALRMPGPLLAVFTLSFLVWLAEFAMYYLVALAFPIGRPYTEIAFGGSAANLAISIPSLPGGVGPFEVAFLGSLTNVGVDRDLASAYIVVLHAALLVPVTVLGLAYLWRENISWGRLTQSLQGKASLKEGRQ